MRLHNKTTKKTKSDLVPPPSAFINIARTDHTWCPWTVPLPLLWSVPVVRPAVLRGPKSGNKLAQGWLKVLIPRKNDVNKIDLGTNIHKFGLPINTFIKFVMDSKVMKKNTYWQSHSAIRLQCNEMRFDYHMFPFSNLVTWCVFSQDQITCISRDMFPNVSPCSCKLIIKEGFCWSQNGIPYPRVFLCGLWVFLAPESYGIILSLRRMPTGIFRGKITQPGSTKVFHLRGSIFSKPIFPQEDHADTFIISIVGENKCILEPQNN